MLTLFYITNQPEIAEIADRCGVNRVWIDLETLGKEIRQKGMNSVKSHHRISDIEVVKPVLKQAKLMVRVNPWNVHSPGEIESVICAGADYIMLPMWKSPREVEKFISVVHNRAKTVLLLETKEAVECVDEILTLPFDEVHIGLNDLHLSYGLTFMFEPLANGMVDMLCEKFCARGIPYGFGGIARIGEGALPAEWVVKEHYRLGSTRAILSRSFCNADEIKDLDEIESIFEENMLRLRAYELHLQETSNESFEKNRKAVQRCVSEIVRKKKELQKP